jgi:4'-phosphopantetheinyl transferase EntD
MGFFDGLLDGRIAAVDMPIDGTISPLFAQEAAQIAKAVPRRQAEFAAGRACAHRAMEALGHPRVPLLRGEDRAPVWPEGLTGSITHTDQWAAAAIGRLSDGIAAIGIDLEPAEPLPPDLWSSICTDQERAQFSGLSPAIAARLVFCMKEAAFKCQFPLSRTLLEFMDLQIVSGPEDGTFAAIFRRDAHPFRCGDRITGRFAICAGHIVSANILHLSELQAASRCISTSRD